MDQKDYQRRRLVEWITAEVNRQVGRRYKVAWEALDDEILRELQRLFRDLDHEKQMAVQQARIQPCGDSPRPNLVPLRGARRARRP